MKRVILLSVFLSFTSYSQDLVDKVYLKNKEVVSGKILKVTSDNIEINPEGEKSFLIIKRIKTELIIYSDNTIVRFNDKNTISKQGIDDNAFEKEKENKEEKKKFEYKSYLPESIDINKLVHIDDADEPPVYPSCKGTLEKKKKCFEKNLKKHILKHYNKKLAKQLITKNENRWIDKNYNTHYMLNVTFVIDKNGNSHYDKHLGSDSQRDEIIRVINLLPKMKPAKLDSEYVSVLIQIILAPIIVREHWLNPFFPN